MKYICFILCSVMVFLLSACSNQAKICRSVECRPLSTTKNLTVWWAPALQSESADFSVVNIYQ